MIGEQDLRWIMTTLAGADCARDLPLPDADFATMLAFAEFHRIEPTFLQAWRQGCATAGIEPPQSLRERQRSDGFKSLAWTQLLSDIVDAFAVAEIACVPLKGPVLSLLLDGANAVRTSVDLDLLVRPADRQRAQAVIRDLGLVDCTPVDPRVEQLWVRARYEWSAIRPRDAARLEMHWDIVPPYLVVPVTTDELISRAITVEAGGREWPWLSPEDNVLFLCIHGAKHGWAQLQLIVDLARFLERGDLDAAVLAERATQWRVRRILALALHCVQGVTGPLADPALADLAADDVAEEMARCIVSGWRDCRPEPGPPQNYQMYARQREHLRDRFGLYWRLLLLPTPLDWQWLSLPRALHWLYPGVRVLRLLSRRFA